MYCSIVQKKMKRKPPESGVFRDPKIKSTFPDDFDLFDFYIAGKDKIKREAKEKWKILLNKSSRRGNKVCKKQWYICTVNYWDIVDTKHVRRDDLWWTLYNHGAFGRIHKHLPDLDISERKKIYAIIAKKFEPIQLSVLREYRKSEEYKYRVIQEEMEENHKEELKEELRSKKTRQKKAFDSFEVASQLDDSEKPIAIEIVKMGFRKLVFKYHPDIGGDKQKMQDLNRIKNKLLNNLSD